MLLAHLPILSSFLCGLYKHISLTMHVGKKNEDIGLMARSIYLSVCFRFMLFLFKTIKISVYFTENFFFTL
jgi:hypothetical protein